jgi:hypothetical protein
MPFETFLGRKLLGFYLRVTVILLVINCFGNKEKTGERTPCVVSIFGNL